MTAPITIPAQTLRDMLTAVLPHAGRDDTLPVLAAVRFEVRAGVLYLIACDRSTVGVAREQIAGAKAAGLPDQSALLPCDRAEAMLAAVTEAEGVAALIFTPGGDLADGEILMDAAGKMSSYRTLGAKFEYPDWRGLLHGALTAETGELTDRFGVAPRLLTRFVMGAGPHDPWEPKPLRLRIAPRVNAPIILVTYGEWFLGAIMAVRCANETGQGEIGIAPPQWRDWAAALAKPEPAADEAPAEVQAGVSQ